MMKANASNSGWLLPRSVLAAILLPLSAVAALAQSSVSQPTSRELFQAIRTGDTRVWRELLAAKPDVNARDTAGNTLLHVAALRGDADAVDALLEYGAGSKAVNEAGATPLHYGTGSERIVAALLARGASADVLSQIGITPLLGAMMRPDSFAVARRLIAAGANIESQRTNPRGMKAKTNVLATAIAGGDRRTIALLLEQGANINPAAGNSPLAIAAFMGDMETTRLLLERGADVNHPSGFAGATLNFALLAGHHDVAALLLERGADPNSKTFVGHGTPPIVLSAHIDTGDPTIARVLTDRGVDLNATNDEGETAFSYALKNGRDTPIIRFLRESGARPPAAPVRAKSIPAREVPTASIARAALIRDSARRAVELLQRNSTAFLENGFVRNQGKCISCHQQGLPAVAFGLARERGLHVDEHQLGQQLQAQIAQRAPQAENARQMDEPTPDAQVSLGYDADALHALRYAPDPMTDAMSHYLLGIQRANGAWPASIRRPPMEDSAIVATAWATRAVQLYPPLGRERDVEDALRRARVWLASQQPQNHNDRVFQLLGLAWGNEPTEQMRRFADRLRETQQTDGSWSQLTGIVSDAWATGSALVALHKAGISTSDSSYQRGVAFLLRTQFDDGSWWVRSRSWPFQPHFDGRFPHGKDQWISAAGTAWATMALLFTIEPSVRPETLPNAQTLIARFKAHPSKQLAQSDVISTTTTDQPKVNFGRDIKPLIQRSCADCHTGDKIKGGFSLASRESVLKGGQSGDPAIIPGRSRDSHLLRYVSDEIEDLEMPPLRRRDKYPALSQDEVALLRTWIDSGAKWDDSR